MDSIIVDDSRYPLLFVTFHGLPSEDEFERYLVRIDEIRIQRGGVTATIMDATRSRGATPKQRRRQAEWLKSNFAVLERTSAGTAFVIDSAIVRGVLTAILWVQPMPGPYTIVATVGEAERWAIANLSQRGLKVPRGPAPLSP